MRFGVKPRSREDDLTTLKDNLELEEIGIDKNTGDVWFKKANGETVSATAEIGTHITNLINNGIIGDHLAYKNNRMVHKIYFNGGTAELDPSLALDANYSKYRIRSLGSDSVYNVSDLTPIGNAGSVVEALIHNKTYYVEFYNSTDELISSIVFTAKDKNNLIAPSNREISYLEIQTVRDFVVLNEDVSKLNMAVLLYYTDGTFTDVTLSPNLTTTPENINSAVKGIYPLNATFIYDVGEGLDIDSSRDISVTDDIYSNIKVLIITPQIVILNDDSQEIRLKICAYYEDNTFEDVTDRAIITGFVYNLFDSNQNITVKLNAGYNSTITENLTINISSTGTISNNTIFYRNNILQLDPLYTIDPNITKYLVRSGDHPEFLYTASGFITIGTDALYVDMIAAEDQMADGKNLIVEFYDENDVLVTADVFVTEYNASVGA